MKAIEHRFLKPLMSILFLGILILSISSCSKDDDATTTATANVMVVNAVENSSAQDFYLDDAKVNSSAVAYTQTNGYFAVNSGNHKADFKSSGSSTVTATTNLSLQANKNYTVYYTGTASSSTAYTTEDDLTAPDAGKAKVRFVHLSSAAASAVDFGVSGGAKIVSGLAYKTASAYQNVSPTASFQLFAAGSSTVGLNLTNLSLQAGKIYTIYISGSTTATITVHVIVNN